MMRSFCSQLARAMVVGLFALTLQLGACNKPPAVNPWRDDSLPAEVWYTPSYEAVVNSGAEPVIRQREVPRAHVPRAIEGVPHYPLWWEDPLEDKGDQNDTFAWTWQDYIGMPYSFGRILLNTMAWPVSAIVTPPGTPMVSDGVIGRDHDAHPGESPDPTGSAADFTPVDPTAANEVGGTRAESDDEPDADAEPES